jgi:predicted translin family RNA/ssDNA-binding protein
VIKETLRKQQDGLPSPKQVKREMTEASKDAVIAAKNKRIKDLKDENKILKHELQMLRGKLYESWAKEQIFTR